MGYNISMKYRLLKLFLLMVLLATMIPVTVFASDPPTNKPLVTPPIIYTTPAASTAAGSGGDLNAWLGTFYIWAIGIGGALAILMIAMAAIDYASSGGDVEKMNGAKEKIVGAVIGLLLLILTYLIVNALHTEAPDTGSTKTTTPAINPSGTESGVLKPSPENPQGESLPDTPATNPSASPQQTSEQPHAG